MEEREEEDHAGRRQAKQERVRKFVVRWATGWLLLACASPLWRYLLLRTLSDNAFAGYLLVGAVLYSGGIFLSIAWLEREKKCEARHR